MTATVFQLLGGIGLFLMGMSLLSEGLTNFAGSSLQKALARFTGTPFNAFLSGTVITALVQSSSATTITLIGFVSAGLVTFSQAIGVVMGASLGTTGTGWLIATVGLKIDLGFYVLPLIGIGAFMKLLGHGRLTALGMALAGFGILFVGIDIMQTGVEGFDGRFTLNFYSDDEVRWWQKMLTLLIGTIATIVLQSSTAMVATTLTAFDAGAINFEQAAILIIGAAIGTTMTGIVAAIGGSMMARRTALAHVLFNLFSGLIAMILLPVLLWIVEGIRIRFEIEAGAMSLAAFHTLFILLGVVIFLPHAKRFAQLIERILPEQPNNLLQKLDQSQQQVPELALTTMEQTLTILASELFEQTQQRCLHPENSIDQQKQNNLQQGLNTARQFFTGIHFTDEHKSLIPKRLTQTHILDHLVRLNARACNVRLSSFENTPPILQRTLELSETLLTLATKALTSDIEPYTLEQIAAQYQQINELRQQAREIIMRETANGYRDSNEALSILDSMRWLDRSCHHVWRICYYLRSENPVADDTEQLIDD
jgi:phosphate:Na+ symporter